VTLAPWPQFDAEQIDAATRVLASGKVNSWTGQDTTAFEQEFAQWCGTAHAIAMANGSLALSAAYLAIGLGPGDELITTPRTFIATASSAVLLGAKPVFADVDAESGAITAATIAPLITPRTKAIAVVHLGGWPADMPAILELARVHGIAVIEDCAQAHGARIHGQSVGSFGDVAAWSFCQDKILTTAGEGGMVTTHRADLWDAMWAFKHHGKTLRRLSGANIPRLPLAARALLLRGPAATAPTSASPNCRAPSAASSCSACPSGPPPAPAPPCCSPKPGRLPC
jgi:dTDP-4-amino-4,6-dideoxygalactose transaminase